MENNILITWLNDFIFCPKSIFYHNLYSDVNNVSFQEQSQINGTAAHENLDNGTYSSKDKCLTGVSVYCDRFNLTGKIDKFNLKTGVLTERKKKIKNIYDGYVLQLYGQYFCLMEMGYKVNSLNLYSMDDNKIFQVPLPTESEYYYQKFLDVIDGINTFRESDFLLQNPEKCRHCIYRELCDSFTE